MLIVLLAPRPGRAQDFITTFRGDEVGPRDLELDEETFLNILSFRQPLESIQPWLSSPSGYRAAMGSLTRSVLWLEQEIKATSPVSEPFRVGVLARQGVDFDSAYVLVQPVLAYTLTEGFEAISPFTLAVDKGEIAGGAGVRYRDPEAGLDYVQLVFTRSKAMFNQRSAEFSDAHVDEPADALELQTQRRSGDLGTTSLKFAYQFGNEIRYDELGRSEEFRRFSGWLLHCYDLDTSNRLFVEYQHDSAGEQITPLTVETASQQFRGERDYNSARLEYQRDLSEDGLRRVRTGFQYLSYREDESFTADSPRLHTIVRSESVVYGGYRLPLGEARSATLDTTVYLDWQNNRNRFPNNPGEDGHDPHFQGKVSFAFRWALSERADFVLDPSFELDSFGWGGGGIQLRYLF
ncbi:MAG: hypothetical protein AB1486_23690 [Planctomycetota bacterium]